MLSPLSVVFAILGFGLLFLGYRAFDMLTPASLSNQIFEEKNLAAAVLSFVSSDKALQDPHIRQRLTAPAQATLADLQLARPKEEPSPA